MALNSRHFLLSVPYAGALCWLLLYEIIPRWNYMNYKGEFSAAGLAVALSASAILGLSVPRGRDARAMIVASLNYMFFIPSAVYASFSGLSPDYFLAFLFAFIGVYYVSRLSIPSPVTIPVGHKGVLLLTFMLILAAVAAQAYFGGLRYFGLSILRVYEFRNISAEEVPAIFGYIFPSVSNVLIPIALILSIKIKRYWLSTIISACSILLFGMTHHKTVLFMPFALVILYYCFSNSRKTYAIGIFFLLVALFCVSEIVYIRIYLGSEDVIAYVSSYVARRVLFTPVMLDSIFVDFFSKNATYYWSSSRFGSWITESPYAVTAPYLIGEKYFSDPAMSANTGIIGSGVANAGLYGVLLYSLIVGVLISSLNGYGKRIGHATVAAVSLVAVFYLMSTTDLTTAILSHGLLLLFVIMSIFSGPTRKDRRFGSRILVVPSQVPS